jgi:hypothetical protein
MKKQRKLKTYTIGGVEMTREEIKKELISFNAMKQRCYNPKNNRYHIYGARGITVCDEWMDKENGIINFIRDLGKRPSERHSIDRINPDLRYTKDNCRWVLSSDQSKNKKNYNGDHKHLLMSYEKIYTHGDVSKTIREWFLDERIEERLGVMIKGFHDRITDGWHHEDLINVPAYGRRKHQRSRLFDKKNDRVIERKPRESNKNKETA